MIYRNYIESKGNGCDFVEQMPILEVNKWIIVSEEGIWMDMEEYQYPTKKEAIWAISCAELDSRKTPKIKRICKGSYEYYPKDCDDGTFGENYNILRITEENINKMQELIENQ